MQKNKHYVNLIVWSCFGQIKRIKEKFRVMNEKLNSHEFAQNLKAPSVQQ